MAWHRNWEKHPAVSTGDKLTAGQRAADHMRNGMGSWPFVFLFLIAMGIWAMVNSILHFGGHHHGFDPYPYILLNLLLSTMAGLQAAALLIAAKRADQISSELALHTDGNTNDIKTLLTQNTELTQAVHDLTQQVRDLVSSPK